MAKRPYNWSKGYDQRKQDRQTEKEKQAARKQKRKAEVRMGNADYWRNKALRAYAATATTRAEITNMKDYSTDRARAEAWEAHAKKLRQELQEKDAQVTELQEQNRRLQGQQLVAFWLGALGLSVIWTLSELIK